MGSLEHLERIQLNPENEDSASLPEDESSFVTAPTIEKEFLQSAEISNEDNNENDHEYRPVDDVYAMLATCAPYSKSLHYALFICFAQMFILLIFVVDQLKGATTSRFMNIPVMNTWIVISGQVLAIYATVMTASDITTSLDMFYVVYDENVEKHLPYASKWRWYASNCLRMIEGILSVIVAFLFIVQSTNNLELFQNFAAVSFVSELDNIAFYIAENGYTVVDLSKETANIKEHFVFKNQPKDKVVKKIQRQSLSCLMLVLYGFFLASIAVQLRGEVYNSTCQSFLVTFDIFEYDYFRFCDICPDAWKNRTDNIVYPNFNGVYIPKKFPNGDFDLSDEKRPTYVQSTQDEEGLTIIDVSKEEPRGIFKYCKFINAWVFTIEGVNKSPEDKDSCDWLMKSQATDEFDFNLVPKNNWDIWTGVIEKAIDLRIDCAECQAPYVENDEDSIATSSSNSLCNYHGKCMKESQLCRCDESSGYIGKQCEVCADCTAFVVSSAHEEFPRQFYHRINDINKEPVQVHNRPAFFKQIEKNELTPDANMVILLYTGNRWAFWNVTERFSGIEYEREVYWDKTLDILHKFHTQWDLRLEVVPFFSEPTRKVAPFNLKWTVGIEEGHDLDFECTSKPSERTCSKMLS